MNFFISHQSPAWENSCQFLFFAYFLWWLSGENTLTKFTIIWAFYIAHIENNFKLNISAVSILRYFILQIHGLLLHLGHISGFGCKISLLIHITVKKSWKTCEQLCLRSSGISVHGPDVLLELLNFSDNYFLFWMWDFQ